MADSIEIMDAIKSLSVHCRAPIMDVDDRSRWLQTWCEDLAEFPLDAIRSGCRTWRQSDNTRFPTPGQLLPLIRAATSTPRDSSPNNKSWSWPTDDELASMTLREQRRQYQIMASQCRGKAGPMDNNGKHPKPEWIGRAQGYDAEAQRVAGLISRGAQSDVNRSGAA